MCHRPGVVEANLDQVYWALNAFGLHRKKEETLALILEENIHKKPVKPWISNRQIYAGSGTVLTERQLGGFVDDHNPNSVYFLAEPLDLSTGYFSAFRAIFSVTISVTFHP